MDNKERKLNRFSNFLLVLAIVFFIFGSGYRLGEYSIRSKQKATASTLPPASFYQNTPRSEGQADLSLFWRVWDTLKVKYVDQSKLKAEDMIYGAIKGMVASVKDPYTYFLTPEENKQSKADLGGLYEGIGAQLGMKDERIIVVSPLKDSPAEKEGLKTNDIIISIDGESTEGWALTQAVNKIRGERGTKVKLGILRAGADPFEVEITREQIKVNSVELSYKQLAGCKKDCAKVALIRVSQFGDDTAEEWDKAVSNVRKEWNAGRVKGLVVDMRGNPGGYLEGAVYLASDFLSPGDLVIRQEYADRTGKDYKVEKQPRLLGIPLVVMINEGSASASEIFAGAVRDHNKATLVGQKSFGKGSVQEAIDLEKGTGLHITIAKWILPGGDWINSKGIKPSVEVENKVENGNTVTDETDTQLQKSIEKLVK